MEEFIAGRALLTRREAVNRNNHYLDPLALACVAGHGIGQKLVTVSVGPSRARQAENSNTIQSISPADWLNRPRPPW